ncbi:MAG: glycoside hydrolase family 127 protein [Clostridia bacterium]|nr:glycoside hydrolase family 127 protein [Clostridia bacterium]
MKPADLSKVAITDGYWKKRADINRTVTLITEYNQLKDTGRLDTFKQLWKEGMPNEPHFFWDSDVAKWIEACAYSLVSFPDKKTEEMVDAVIDDIERAQWEDGYLNSYYTVKDKTARWTNLLIMHELYCAGHLMEAAVAYFQATGKDRLLNIMCRYADHINSVFGPEKGKLRGYPGHEEIELALVKLYNATGKEEYLRLSEYFVTERGRQPSYFDAELERTPGIKRYNRDKGTTMPYAYVQAHAPVTDQETIEGHSVRALYFLSGVADVAAITGRNDLLEACEKLYANMTQKRMYITGGVGDTPDIERFSYDYNLPNETAYAETCAAIASVFFCSRMLNITGNGKYGDTMELALHNGIMSGISLDGTEFFYSNPLAVEAKAVLEETLEFHSHMGYKRRKWFGCACCPPNIARLLSSLGSYFYSTDGRDIRVNLYGSSEFLHEGIKLSQTTDYPWDETVKILFSCETPSESMISLRIPGWCEKHEITINGGACAAEYSNGFAQIKRIWHDGDEITLFFHMPVVKMQAHPNVRHDTGKLALMRGPVVYCLEEEDNGKHLAALFIQPADNFDVVYDNEFLGGCAYLSGRAFRLSESGYEERLYKPFSAEYEEAGIKAIPYAMWSNRNPGDMLVWINAMTTPE